MATEFPQSLIHRKQFFFGPEKRSAENWKHLSLSGGSFLSYHSELAVTQAEANGLQAAMLGYILDPERINDSNQEIVQRVCSAAKSIQHFIELTEPLSGRWIFFLTQGEDAIAFNDPAGLRTIFHHVDDDGRLWLASHSGLLSERFGFQVTPQAAEFMNSARFQERNEGWFTGDSTPFAEVRHLLPNHLIDLRSHQVKRFWPVKELRKVSLDEAVATSAHILRQSILAASKRAPLAMSMSSGVDSRMILAAARDLTPDLFFFSMMYRSHTPESDDIRVPREIAAKMGLKHHVLDSRGKPAEDFKLIFDQHVAGVRYDWASIVQQRYENIPQDGMVLKGSISEIVRCRYFGLGNYPYRVTLSRMVNLMNVGQTDLVYSTLQEWMKEAISVEPLGYTLLDMLSWECEVGNYLSMGQLLYDLAQEDFCPLNNRKLLNIMLGVDPKYRSYPFHILERKITEALWPELVSFPYTPSRKLPTKSLRDVRLLQWLKYVFLEPKKDRTEK